MMIIRDPIDRLVSAYKNHVACDDVVQWKGPSDREAIVLHLLKLRDKDDKLNADVMQMEAKKRCLSFKEYVIVLADIHQMGKDSFINGHFRPQSCDCFIEQNQSEKSKYRVPEKLWTVVGTISNTSSFDSSMIIWFEMDYREIAPNSSLRRKYEVYLALFIRIKPKGDTHTMCYICVCML